MPKAAVAIAVCVCVGLCMYRVVCGSGYHIKGFQVFENEMNW